MLTEDGGTIPHYSVKVENVSILGHHHMGLWCEASSSNDLNLNTRPYIMVTHVIVIFTVVMSCLSSGSGEPLVTDIIKARTAKTPVVVIFGIVACRNTEC